MPEEDAVQLQQQLSQQPGPIPTGQHEGLAASVQLLSEGQVDLAFVQGGIPLPEDLLAIKNPSSEAVLYFVREGVHHPHGVKRIMTSSESQGSHAVAQVFTQLWQIDDQVRFTYDWRSFSHDDAYRIPADVDAVFVVKDMAEHEALYAAERLSAAGFRLTSPDLGAHAMTLEYLQRTEIPRGYWARIRRYPISRSPPTPWRRTWPHAEA